MRDSKVHMGFRPVAALAYARLECFDAAAEIAFLQSQIPKTEPCVFGRIAALSGELRIVLLRFFFCALLLENGSQIVKNFRNIGTNLQRALIGFARSFQIAQLLPDHAEIDMRLLAFGTNPDRFRVRFRGIFLATEFLIRDAEIECALKVVRGRFYELFAIPGGSFVIFVGKCAGRESFERGLRVRSNLNQALRIAANRLNVLARNPDRDQIYQGLFRIFVIREYPFVDVCRFIEAPCELQPDGLSEQRSFVSPSLRPTLDRSSPMQLPTSRDAVGKSLSRAGLRYVSGLLRGLS